MKFLARMMCALALLCAYTVARADVPTNMSVQGRLTNGAGAPVPAGLKNFTFKIFDQQIGGVEIWPIGPGETQTLTTDASGLWNASVGQLIPLTETVFQSPARWLEVTVYDGVTTETLPRIELKTNPYTYRAATSQHADSLGGSTLSDLTGRFVDEAGDTMSGPLRGWSDLWADGALLDARNLNGGSATGYGFGYWGVIGEASGTTTDFRIGTAGIANGSPAGGPAWGAYGQVLGDNAAGPSYAVYGVNMGAGSGPTYAVYGDNMGLGSGPAFSGYFTGGDFAVLNPKTAGTSGVLLPSNAISSGEIEDEAGIANSVVSFPSWGGSGTVYVVDSVEIDIPTSGYVEVEAQLGWVNVMHSAGVYTELWCGVSPTPASYGLEDGTQVIRLPSDLASSGLWAIPMQASRVFAEAAGLHKYYLNLYYFSGAGASISTGRPYIRARFYPTLYGSVSFSESSITTGTDDEAARLAAARPGATRIREITVEDHQAAMETELKTLRERLEALEAAVQRPTSPYTGGQ